MMSQNTMLWAVMGLVFLCVALLSYAAWTYLLGAAKVRRRFGTVEAGGTALDIEPAQGGLREALDPSKLGIDPESERQLRLALVKAGFFSQNAVVNFTLARFAAIIGVPFLLYIALENGGEWAPFHKMGILAGAFLLAYYLPQAYLKRRQRLLQQKFRTAFPDFLDLMVVCVDAGLSLEAALERVTQELGSSEPELHANLGVMAGEMRAGRGTIEALQAFAERLGLEEANSLVLLLQQSVELGTDVAQALRTFSDEMRDKRFSLAEEKAHALPAKLVLPLGIFIFPVILIVVLTPLMIRILSAFT